MRMLPLMMGALVLGTSAFAQGPGRQVYLPPAADFVPAFKDAKNGQTIVEFVPKGETVNAWSRMITLQTLPLGPGMTENSFMVSWTRRYTAACPRAAVNTVPLSNGLRGVRIDCPRNPMTGRPETVFARVIPMGRGVAMVQVANAGIAMPAHAGWARDFLGKVTVR